ncbi:MAG: four helix bundle protein [Opitutaceae bacterium]
MQISHFTELIVYQRSLALAGQIFDLSKRWPPEERYALTDQIRRAARSVGANIAEAWGKRRYELHFVSKRSDADAENHEIEHWLIVAHQGQYLSADDYVQLQEQKREVGRMLGSMILNPTPFLLKKL